MKQKTPTRIRKLAPISKVSPAADGVVNPSNNLNGGGGSARRKKRLTKTRQKSKSTAVLSKIVDSRRVAILAGCPAKFRHLVPSFPHIISTGWSIGSWPRGRGIGCVAMKTLLIQHNQMFHDQMDHRVFWQQKIAFAFLFFCQRLIEASAPVLLGCMMNERSYPSLISSHI